jgi:hypothetical protein
MNGFLPCSQINLNELSRHPVDVSTVAMSTRQFATFSATVRTRIDDDDDAPHDGSARLVAFNIPLLATW